MGRDNKYIPIAVVIIVAFILQVVLIAADHHESPGKAAVEFSKAYFKLNPAMEQRLCGEMTEDEQSDVVEDYLYRMADQAKAEGFDVSWMKMVLSHIETETQMVDENMAEVRITCSRRRAINPVFAMVAKIFCLGKTHEVEEILTLVKEDDRWKVCGEPFALFEG